MIHKRLKQIDDLLGDMLTGAEKYMTTELQRLVGVSIAGRMVVQLPTYTHNSQSRFPRSTETSSLPK